MTPAVMPVRSNQTPAEQYPGTSVTLGSGKVDKLGVHFKLLLCVKSSTTGCLMSSGYPYVGAFYWGAVTRGQHKSTRAAKLHALQHWRCVVLARRR